MTAMELLKSLHVETTDRLKRMQVEAVNGYMQCLELTTKRGGDVKETAVTWVRHFMVIVETRMEVQEMINTLLTKVEKLVDQVDDESMHQRFADIREACRVI